MRLLIASLIGASLLLAGTASAATINVPADYATIQEAVDVAVNGDQIVVAPGIHFGTGDTVVDMLGKSIQLRSSGGSASTFIDGQGSRRGITCSGGETSGTLISGFTIINGRAPGANDEGGGVWSAANSTPVFRECHITENLAWSGPGMMIRGAATIINCDVTDNHSYNDTSASSIGGGICCLGDATISGCRILDNGSYWGGGVTFQDCNALIKQCTLAGNSGVLGGGIYIRNQSPTIDACTIAGNNAEWGGAMYLFNGSSPSILNCTMDGNDASGVGGAMVCYLHGAVTLDNCTISNNTSLGNGGGIWIYYSSADMTITNCRITGNIRGGLYSDLGLVTVSDSLVCGNAPFQLLGPWNDGGGNEIAATCTLGACCDGGDCTITTLVECLDIPGGTWLGDGTTCDDCLAPDEGACCLPEEFRGAGCVITDPVNCMNLGGDWMGSGTDCTACIPPPQQGGCCLASGCMLLWEDECLGIGGQWLGDGVDCSNCPNTGACCLCDGCLVTWEQDCQDAGGDWLANAECADCPPTAEVGPCCMASGCIMNASEADCTDNLGEWLGANGDCVDCPQPCFGDLNGDWVVDIDDLLILLGSYGTCP